MRRIFLPKNCLSFILMVVMLFACNFSFAQTGQTNCGWQQGDLFTRHQVRWDATLSDWWSEYDATYEAATGRVEVGIPGTSGYSLRFTGPDKVSDFFVQIGTAAVLNVDLVDGNSSSSGQFGGEVLALRLNIDFSDAGFLAGNVNVPFGNLILYDITTAPELNGLSVREIIAIANFILGGGSSTFEIVTINTIVSELNSAFLDGTPSQFAQEHLKRGWSNGDMRTYNQAAWGNASSDAGSLMALQFSQMYGANALMVGEVNRMTFTSASSVDTYLPASGTPGTLSGSLTNPVSSPAGEFGGQVVTLTLNVDFSDADFLAANSSVPLGDLVIHNFSLVPQVNGMTVREFLDMANIIIGGGSAVIGASTASAVANQLNNAFIGGTPSQFALDHLKRGWRNGDMLTYSQSSWGDASTAAGILLNANFDLPLSYPHDFVIGTPNTLRFTSAGAIIHFLPAVGSSSVLVSSLQDPSSSPAGALAGEAMGLKLNVDFSDLNLIVNSVPLGDLVFHGFSSLPQINGLSVRQFLDSAAYVLGGGTGSSFSPTAAASAARFINGAFIDGAPSAFAQQFLNYPCISVNHCPTATSSNVSTSVGTAVNIQLQATDEDNDELSYSISQDPLHGTVTTSASGAAIYTPTAGYYGADEFKFKADDGECESEATVTITIVKCPEGKGYWKNNPNSWPAGATPMLLGTQSYTKAQLLVILNTQIGSGPKADASLILAQQLIAAKLNVANGAAIPSPVPDSIAAADILIGNNRIPMKVKPNTPLGQRMVNNAAYLETYNKGLLTAACRPVTESLTSSKQQNVLVESSIVPVNAMEIKAYPNPSATNFTIIIKASSAKGKITMQVIDMYGRFIETRNVVPNSNIRFGDKYRPGTYFIRILQAKDHKELKLVKLPG